MAGLVNLPSERIFPSKQAAAVVTFVIALFHMYALMMPLKIRLSYKFLVAVRHCAGERVLPLLVVSFHVRFEVVAPTEELATPLYFALEVGLLLRR